MSDAYDFIFGSHDAAAFIRREEEKLVEAGDRAEDESSKLSRRASQQRKAIEKFNQRYDLRESELLAVIDFLKKKDLKLSQGFNH